MRWLRRLTGLARRRPLRLVYHPEYETVVPGVPLDPQRGGRVLAFLEAEGLTKSRDIARPHAVSVESLLRVHTVEHVAALDRLDTATRVFGMAIDDRLRQAVLDAQRVATGGTVQAARLARRTGGIAVNLGGGFHHATGNQPMAFCLINDVAVAIAHLRHYGFTAPILVIDLDLHDGNGTRAIFADDPSVHTLSIHNEDWAPAGGVANTSIALGTAVDDERYLATVGSTLPGVIESHEPALAIYVAGTDPAVDDRLGDWSIGAEAMLERDRFVIEALRRRGGMPIAIVLAGGYGRRAWRYTARFLSWLVAGRAYEPISEFELALQPFRAARSALLAGDSDPGWGITEEDLLGMEPGAGPSTRVLGSLSRHGIELSLERAGFLQEIRRCGFAEPVVAVDIRTGLGDTIRIFGAADRRDLLMELRVNRSKSAVVGMEVLYVEWLLLQNPKAEFTDASPRLPGQEHPGLGLLREVLAWLVVVCETLGLDGMAFVPSQYYMAVVGRNHMRFAQPDAEARFRALYAALARLSLPEASGALEEGRVVDGETGEPATWEASLQVFPVSERMREAMTAAGGDEHAYAYVLRP